MNFGTYFVIFVLHSFLVFGTHSKMINLKNVWMLPEDNYQVFYRYFDEKISWFEADNVCNFHHGNLITIKTENNMDVLKAYLKELEINETLWIGLNRKDGQTYFSWPDNEEVKNVQLRSAVGDIRIDNVTNSDNDNNNQSKNCVSIEPNLELQWTKSSCDRPICASFICEVKIPDWANADNGCLLTSVPSVTTIYIMEDDVFELVSDCRLKGTKSVTCKDKIERCELMDQLSCDFDDDIVVDNGTSFKGTNHSKVNSITTNMPTTLTPKALNLILTPKPATNTTDKITKNLAAEVNISTILTPKPLIWNDVTESSDNDNSSKISNESTLKTNITEQDNFEQGLIEIDVSNIEEDANSTVTDTGYEMQVASVQNLTVIESDEADLTNSNEKGHIRPYVISRFVG